MSLAFELLLHKVVHPIVYWIGWSVVYVLTLGRVRPSPQTRYTNRLVGLLGIYIACFLPAGIFVLYRQLSGG